MESSNFYDPNFKVDQGVQQFKIHLNLAKSAGSDEYSEHIWRNALLNLLPQSHKMCEQIKKLEPHEAMKICYEINDRLNEKEKKKGITMTKPSPLLSSESTCYQAVSTFFKK